MPSASSKSSQPQTQVCTNDLMQEPLKNAVSVLDKKLRNLEKRKLKLLETKKKADIGSELNQDQKKAVENLALVDNSVATVKELHKNLTTLDQEFSRLVKKEQKRVKQEKKDQADNQSLDLAFKIVEVQGILGDLTEEVRPDFVEGINGACKLSEEDLANLDAFYELVSPAAVEGGEKKLSVRVKLAAEHLIDLVQGKDKPVVEDVTYKSLLDTVNRILVSGYFDKHDATEEQPATEEEEEEAATEELISEEEEAPESPKTPETPEDESPTIEFTHSEFTEPSTPDETPEPNGVDLPPEVQQTPDDEKIDFLGESEISTGNADQNPPSLNPVSPEFVPRTMQQSSDDGSGWDAGSNQRSSETSNSDGWQSVPDNQGNNQGGGSRGRGGRGRGMGGRGRGRGGSGGEYRGRQDGNYRGNYRGGNRGEYRGGSRGGGEYRGGRGGPRGGRGGPRGGGSRGGFGKPQEQQ